jgi:hypothetical protein
VITYGSTAYDPEQWHDLFVAVAGASAALAGLLFVAVSINLSAILALPGLPRRAAETVGMLALLLLESILVLVPGQTRQALGIELWALGLVVVVGFVIAWSRSSAEPERQWYWTAVPFVTLVLASLPTVVAGASVMAGSGGGLYWLVGGLVAGFAGALINAWVLLVEILR